VGQFMCQLVEVGQLCVSGEQPTLCSSYVIILYITDMEDE